LKHLRFDSRFAYAIEMEATSEGVVIFECKACVLSACAVLFREPFQVGSLAGAAHLRNDSEGAQRSTQKGRKPFVVSKVKSRFEDSFQ